MALKHISGGKISTKHTTIITDAFKIINKLTKKDFIKKISLGYIKPNSSRGGLSAKILPLGENSVRLHFKGKNFQEIRVFFTSDGNIEQLTNFLKKYIDFEYG